MQSKHIFEVFSPSFHKPSLTQREAGEPWLVAPITVLGPGVCLCDEEALQRFKACMSVVGRVSSSFSRPPHNPGGVQVLETWQIVANHVQSRNKDLLQSLAAAEQKVMEEVSADGELSSYSLTSSAATGSASSECFWWGCWSLQHWVTLTAPGHQIVNLPPVSGLAPTKENLTDCSCTGTRAQQGEHGAVGKPHSCWNSCSQMLPHKSFLIHRCVLPESPGVGMVAP